MKDEWVNEEWVGLWRMNGGYEGWIGLMKDEWVCDGWMGLERMNKLNALILSFNTWQYEHISLVSGICQ